MEARTTRNGCNGGNTGGFEPRTLLRIYFMALWATGCLLPQVLEAQDYAVTVSRDEADYYTVEDSFQGVIKTQNCFEFAFFDPATLRLVTATTGTLFFSNGSQCPVVNLFLPATVAPGSYQVVVDSEGNGYYELTDGTFLIKANGFDFVFSANALLEITSAINGTAAGTITVGTSFPRSLTNIYVQNAPADVEIDLALTGLDLRTNPFDSGGVVVNNPAPGTTLYPHIFFDIVGGSIPEIVVYEIRLGNNVVCDFVGELAAGSYWDTCGPISIPNGNFTLSGSLDPNNSLSETNEVNNDQILTFIVTDLVFEDGFEQ